VEIHQHSADAGYDNNDDNYIFRPVRSGLQRVHFEHHGPAVEGGSTERTFTTLRTFDQKGLYHTMYGIGYGKGKNPIVNVIECSSEVAARE
jgi:hypothetical protein